MPRAWASPGDRYAHFTLYRRSDGSLDCLGVGGMGTTYRAFDTQLERPVALKTINPQHLHDPESRSRFLREAKAAARLQHPHIASVLFQGEQDGTCFYVMELVSGETLEEYIQRTGPLEPAAALVISHQVALALDAAHRVHLLHRDLKPGNIMLTAYHDARMPHVKVIDFGLAKFLHGGSGTLLTQPGFMGTPAFASPEQCQELPVDCRSDLYSLGATLWFTVTGRPPFSGGALSVLQAQVERDPDFNELGMAGPQLEPLLRRLMAKSPDERPATPLHAAHEIELALEQLGGPPASPPPPPATQAPPSTAPRTPRILSKKLLLAAAGTLTAIVLGALAVGMASRRAPRTATVDAPSPGAPPAETASPEAGVDRPAPSPEPVPPVLPPATVVPASAPEPAPTTPPTVHINSLGMRFVPLPHLGGLISVWETRVSDYAAFIQSQGAPVPADPGTWSNPGFPQGPDHPVVWITAREAMDFCAWLTERERTAGRIAADQLYRLPTRLEFDAAWGTLPPGYRTSSPSPRTTYPWGETWPPPPGAGNFADLRAREAGATAEAIADYADPAIHTAPVGASGAGPGGLFDLAGNVWEMIVRHPREGASHYQGGGWNTAEPAAFQAHQARRLEDGQRAPWLGFRCVLTRDTPNAPPAPREPSTPSRPPPAP